LNSLSDLVAHWSQPGRGRAVRQRAIPVGPEVSVHALERGLAAVRGFCTSAISYHRARRRGQPSRRPDRRPPCRQRTTMLQLVKEPYGRLLTKAAKVVTNTLTTFCSCSPVSSRSDGTVVHLDQTHAGGDLAGAQVRCELATKHAAHRGRRTDCSSRRSRALQVRLQVRRRGRCRRWYGCRRRGWLG